MKFLSLFFLLLFVIPSSSLLRAQNLSLKELQSLAEKSDYTDVDRYLRGQGWGYYNSEQGSSYEYNTITWAYNKNRYEDKAEAWCYLYTVDGFPNKIHYQFHTSKQLSAIESSMSSYGYKKIEGNILDGEVVTKYANSSYILAISYLSSQDDDYYGNTKTKYIVYLIKKASVYDPDNGPKSTYGDDGGKLEYILKDGEMHGKYTTYYESGGVKNKGEFNHGKRNGRKQEYDEDGTLIFDYNLKMDSLDGSFKQYYYNGQLMEEFYYSNGAKHGPIITYYSNGAKEAEYAYKNGQINGVLKVYEMDGKLKLQKNMVNGKNEGNAKEYNNGILVADYNYLNDKLEGSYKKYENGYIKEFYQYQLGEKTGEGLVYYYDVDVPGKLKAKFVSQFKNDEQHGKEELFFINKDSTEELKSYFTYLNGVEHGPFMASIKDTLKFGNYRNGKLHGKYIAYFDVLVMFNGGFARTDSTLLQLATEGEYYEGARSGYWRYFSMGGGLASEGYYKEDIENGLWKYYYAQMVEGKSHKMTPYSGELYMTETYENKDLVKVERFSGLEKTMTPCDNVEGSHLPTDTCYTYVYDRYSLVKHLKDGELNGKYYYKCESENIEEYGNYKKGQRDGTWTNISLAGNRKLTKVETYYRDEEHGPYKFLINDTLVLEGNAKYGINDGLFREYFSNGKIEQQYTFKDNKLHGPKFYYFDDGGVSWSEYYNEDEQKSFTVYYGGTIQDTFGHVIVLSKNGSTFNTESKVFYNDTIEVYTTSFIKTNAANLDWADVVTPINEYKNGRYFLYNSKYECRIEGYFSSNMKNGRWVYYYPELDVISTATYNNGVIGIEEFKTISTNELCSGKLTIPDYTMGTTEIIKVKDGKRHGKTIIEGSDGKPINKFTYKEGILNE